jgi:hypothetical protein
MIFAVDAQHSTARPDSIEARADSLLWIRSRLGNGAKTAFEIGGQLRAVAPARGVLRITQASLQGLETLPVVVTRAITGRRSAADSAVLRFAVPPFAGRLQIDHGAVILAPTRR